MKKAVGIAASIACFVLAGCATPGETVEAASSITIVYATAQPGTISPVDVTATSTPTSTVSSSSQKPTSAEESSTEKPVEVVEPQAPKNQAPAQTPAQPAPVVQAPKNQAPVYQAPAPAPVQVYEAPAPVVEPAPAPVVEPAPAPVVEPAPAPVVSDPSGPWRGLQQLEQAWENRPAAQK